ncbi:HNH endonuclease signature motif containing protein [Erwinia amylovora]|uniref:HNH endonuclease signature motif containing protein n=1 Tax=Erwinia amylovora TaxID=552 RepID=UPI0014447E94|nr:HNH endonuclease signature motif containing protein [Erwinia amylovora]
MKSKNPLFTIKRKSQKGKFLFSDVFSNDVLTDICYRITGRKDYHVTYDNDGYNKGRLARLEFNGKINYISISESNAEGRNSSFQSATSALVAYHNDSSRNKEVFFYFVNYEGNIKTKYFNFMYRLMATAGFIFLNDDIAVGKKITHFNNIDDLILNKDLLRNKNKANNSSYITINDKNITQIYAKTYGANKKESTLMCLALANLDCKRVELIQVSEGSLTKLPKPDLSVIQREINILEIQTDKDMERDEFIKNDSLRSPTFIYNLLNKIGQKKCSFCDCEIPQIIQGAHIWPVSEIKKINSNDDEKLKHALSENNGIWLCENHHKLYDRNIIVINENGGILVKNSILKSHENYIKKITINKSLPNSILSNDLILYINKRNASIEGMNNDFSLIAARNNAPLQNL